MNMENQNHNMQQQYQVILRNIKNINIPIDFNPNTNLIIVEWLFNSINTKVVFIIKIHKKNLKNKLWSWNVVDIPKKNVDYTKMYIST